MILGRPIYANLCLVLAFLLTGCGPKGPTITDCTPRPKTGDFLCFNEANKKQSILKPISLDNWIFVSAADELSIQRACLQATGWPKIRVCSFSANQMAYVCYDEVSGASTVLAFANSGGFIGVSPVDEQILLDFCSHR